MSEISFLAGQASLWVIPDGPNTKPLYLGCHGVGDITEPKGDVTLQYCPDKAASGKFIVKNRFQGEPGAVTTTIETDIRKTADYLETLGKCVTAIYVHKVTCGRRDVFPNFDRSFVLRNALVTNHGLANLAARTPTNEDESLQSFDVSADDLMNIFDLEISRYAITETENVTGIAVCGEERCASDCNVAQSPSDYLFAASEALSGSAANVADVLDSIKGVAWDATAADPFVGGEDIQGIVCFMMDKDTLRIVVARGTTDGANPAEIAYSDDYGATWTTVDVGSTVGEFVSDGHALFALDRYHMWVGTDGGRIYFSSDAGVTWAIQENAAISATNITGVSFVDPNVGFVVYTGGEVAKTTNGAQTDAVWSATAVSGSVVATDIHAITSHFVYVSGTDGKFYTHDAGVTFATRDAVPIAAIDFYNELFGLAVGSAASANIYYTMDGGYTWSPLPAIANSGYLDVQIVSPSLAYVTGQANGGTGFIARIQPAP
ncbi:hypothetical protein LCGC14_1122730 [marine sediment metagenome]|uniref:Photosynthesis system II assembly factor Ycf48/Hcf136-like domain-containing protein n=1 Tax=marine sediment metagenome TaxID=412755 RepID=A0A0F9Q9B2_9ZZZZ